MEELVELMCAAAWNVHGKPPWHEIPEAWKPFHRECMKAALAVAQNPHLLACAKRIDELKQRDAEARRTQTPIDISEKT